jgi:hypothetical protein
MTSSENRGGRSGAGERLHHSASVITMLIIISPSIYAHLSPPHDVRDDSHQTAQYHAIGPKLGSSPITRHLAGLKRVQVIIAWRVEVTTSRTVDSTRAQSRE